MNLNNQKELFSIAMTSCIASAAGCSTQEISKDLYGVDVELKGINWPGVPQINVQLKSTADTAIIDHENERICYPLDADNYNKLTSFSCNPYILILALVPKDPQDWLKINNDNITLHNSLYWVKLKGDQTKNRSTKTIHIPLQNVFNVEILNDMMSSISDHGEIIL
jgi:hypothetical protein